MFIHNLQHFEAYLSATMLLPLLVGVVSIPICQAAEGNLLLSNGHAGPSHISIKAANIHLGQYVYTDDLMKLEECNDNAFARLWPTGPTPIHLDNWMEFVLAHPDHKFAAYIHSGLSAGFRIGFNYQGPTLRSAQKNHASASANKGVVRDYISSELAAGRLISPLPSTLLPLTHSCPIGLVPKSHQTGKWRTIVDLSFPMNHSINDGISRVLSTISYASIDDAHSQVR